MSNIEWTEKTWNPTVGCSEVSRGCTNCYAAKMAYRLIAMGQKDYEGTVKKLPNEKIVWTGLVKTLEHKLLLPVMDKKPTTFFVNSMSDLFHEDIPFAFIDKVFAVMMLCPQHIFQVLTKRPARMLEYCQSRQDLDEIREAAETIVGETPHLFYVVEKMSKEAKKHSQIDFYITNELLPHLKAALWYSGTSHGEWGNEHEFFYEGEFPSKHIWLGTSIENQKAADERGKPLFDLHNMGWVTWVSNEPCVGPIDWETPFYFGFLDWMVTGGESGSTADPMHPDWARATRDFCKKNNIPFFFKQWGQYYTTWRQFGKEEPVFKYYNSYEQFTQKLWVNKGDKCISIDGTLCRIGSDMMNCKYPVAIMQPVGKHKSGRLLDGVQHDEYPKAIKQLANGTK